MNHFERVAIFTLVENIENQLRGLKTLIAASANTGAPAEHKVSLPQEDDSYILSDELDAKLTEKLNEGLKEQVKTMAENAQNTFRSEWDLGVKAMSNLDG